MKNMNTSKPSEHPPSDRSYEEIFQENFGGGVKNFLGKKKNSHEEIFRKFFLAQNFLRKFRLEFSQPRNFLETRGNFTRNFWDHLIIELVPFPSTG